MTIELKDDDRLIGITSGGTVFTVRGHTALVDAVFEVVEDRAVIVSKDALAALPIYPKPDPR